MVFSPDGKTIASPSADNKVKIWNWDFDNLVEKGCERFKPHLADNPEKLAELEICQNEEIIKIAASTLVEEGEELTQYGDFEAAVEKFRKANQWDSQLDINPEGKAAIAFVVQGKKLVRDGKVKEAIAAYNKALEINAKLKISTQYWNALCWYGAINNHAKDVMFACEKAVALEPKNGNIIDSRGLARALTGDTSGAIKDFEVLVKQTDDEKLKSQRQGWIKDLRNGKNPFTPEELEKLR